MINYTYRNGNKRSLTLLWVFFLAVIFAIKGQWYLHLFSVAVGELVAIAFTMANKR